MRAQTLAALSLLSLVACGDPSLPVSTIRSALTDFAGGVVAANHPAGAGQYGVWYDAADNTFGTPSAATLGGAPAMRIDDGGFANGVYAIFAGAVPSTGRYRVEARMRVVETGATNTSAIDAYQMGVAVGAGAVHRGPNPSAVHALPVFGSYVGLTDGDDTLPDAQIVATSEFDAVGGDDVLVAFGTDVTSGLWNAASATWGGAHVLVAAVVLIPVAADPVIVVDDGAAGFSQSGAWTVSSGVGFNGGTYRFASAGSVATATWTAALAPGFYDVEVIYRAGTNRASSAAYSVALGGQTLFARTIDQQYRDLRWVRLGLIEVVAASAVSVSLDAASSGPSGRVVIADAVRFVPSAGPPPVDPPELRLAAVTVFDHLDDIGAIQVMIDDLVDLHYNAVAVHARFRGDATYLPNRGDTTYPNSEPRSGDVGSVDVLEEFVTRGHAAGLRVFAYVNTHLVTEGADVPLDPLHVVNAHPDWRTWSYGGGVPAVQTVLDDPEGLWLEPALPQVREYLADIAGDIARNYAIDGVILDRIRYPQTGFTRQNRDFGYHPTSVAIFNFEYGKSGTPDPYDRDWIEFRQRAVTRTVGRIYERLQAIDPSLMLLAYPIGRFDDAIDFNYQDWPRWLSEHRIDGVLPQIYTPDSAQFAARLAEHDAAYGGDRMLGVTTNAFSAGIDVADQLELARAAGFGGVSPFRHGTMGALGYFDDLEEAWDGIAPFPEMPWKGVDLKPLRLRGACSEWRVQNVNPFSVEMSWWIVGSAQQGRFFAPPGETRFNTVPVGSGINLMLATWYDHHGRLRATSALSLPIRCASAPEGLTP